MSVRELSENLPHVCPTRPKSGRAKPVETLGPRWVGLVGVTPAGGLLISRLKVRFLHGSPPNPSSQGAAPGPPLPLCPSSVRGRGRVRLGNGTTLGPRGLLTTLVRVPGGGLAEVTFAEDVVQVKTERVSWSVMAMATRWSPPAPGLSPLPVGFLSSCPGAVEPGGVRPLSSSTVGQVGTWPSAGL